MNMQMSQPASVLRYLIAGMLKGGGMSTLQLYIQSVATAKESGGIILTAMAFGVGVEVTLSAATILLLVTLIPTGVVGVTQAY
jgi:hypothetical protein